MSLSVLLEEYQNEGYIDFTNKLGTSDFPQGYIILQDPFKTFFFFIREDGEEGEKSWDKWRVKHWAIKDSLKFNRN